MIATRRAFLGALACLPLASKVLPETPVGAWEEWIIRPWHGSRCWPPPIFPLEDPRPTALEIKDAEFIQAMGKAVDRAMLED